MNVYLRILFTIGLAAFALFFANTLLSKGMRNFDRHDYQKLHEIFKGNNDYDVLFIGSSRVHTAINPKVIDSITGLSTYNAGLDGSGLPEFKMIFDAFVASHNTPKAIVLTLDLDSFDELYKFFNYNSYLEFLDNKIVEKTLSNNGFRTTPFKLFPFLRITQMDDIAKRNAILGLRDKEAAEVTGFQYKGYLSNGNDCIHPRLDTLYKMRHLEIQSQSVALLNSMIQSCREKKIQLLFTYSTEYNFRTQGYVDNAKEIFNFMNSIAKVNNLDFYRDDSLNICFEKCLFANYAHLNNSGAFQYSVIMAKRLQDKLR
jgi:hypothetical protein